MKRVRWLIPCLIVALALGTVGCAQRDGQVTIPVSVQQNTGVWVTGQGEVMAIPDIATLSLGIEAQKDTVAEAQAQANEAMNDVMETLKDNGIDEKDIQTQRFSIYPITRWLERENKEEIIGYRVTNMVTAKIRKVDEAGVVIDAVARAGGDYIRIQNISFAVDDTEPYYEEAREKAMEDAKNKAEQLADLAGVRLGKPTYVSEGAVYLPPITRDFYEGGMAVPAAPETSISPGELKLTLNVQVTYAIA
ncbi:MAG: SIMPL domain-containing protein [Dehalococcoidia bacterium]|nr:SIMPL domain-containing protein [Dehalococcoidia bacterium]